MFQQIFFHRIRTVGAMKLITSLNCQRRVWANESFGNYNVGVHISIAFGNVFISLLSCINEHPLVEIEGLSWSFHANIASAAPWTDDDEINFNVTSKWVENKCRKLVIRLLIAQTTDINTDEAPSFFPPSQSQLIVSANARYITRPLFVTMLCVNQIKDVPDPEAAHRSESTCRFMRA